MPSIDTRITRVEQDPNGWYRIHTDDPRIKRLDTKQEPLAKEAQAFMRTEALVRIEFSEREGNINTNTGQPFINRYYERGTQLGETPAQDDGIPRVTPTRAVTDPREAWRICLAAGGKLAVMTMPMLAVADRTIEKQMTLATAWAEFFFFSQAPERPSFNGAVFPEAGATGAAGTGAGALAREEDPFPAGY